MPRRARPATDQRILVGDCRDRLAELADSSVDAMVTDPPSGAHYGDQAWDRFGPDDANGSATPEALASYRSFLAGCFEQAHRVLKPGAFAVVWAFPRTCHHTMTALEDAGFNVRDVITHHYATGNPKTMCPGQPIDRSPSSDAGEWGAFVAEHRRKARISRGKLAAELGQDVSALRVAEWERGLRLPTSRERMRLAKLFGPEGYVTSAAQQWHGWGTALKPATEFWVLARKPLEGGDLGRNALHWGTGAMPIYAVRTGADGGLAEGGRWPTNLVMTHAAGCKVTGQRKVKTPMPTARSRQWGASGGANNWGRGREVGRGDAKTPSMETVPVWSCEEGCPVRLIEAQSGRDGTGRYFPAFRPEPGDTINELVRFCDKTGGRERPVTSSGAPHLTPKALPLMRWLVRLVTPPGGTVIDPFLGSGATAEAAMIEGLDWAGCEIADGRDGRHDYVSLVQARVERFERGESPGQVVARPSGRAQRRGR